MTTSACPLAASNNDSNNNSKTANTRITTTTTQTAKPQPPLSARRRPQNLKFSLLLLAILMCQLQQFAGGGAGCVALAMAAPAPVPVSPPAPSPAAPLSGLATSTSTVVSRPTTRNRTRRLHKRHDQPSFKERFHLELNSSALDWSNGCGGNYEQAQPLVKPHKRCAKHKKNKTRRELRQLRVNNKLRHTVNTLSAPDTSANQAIDISQRNIWKVQSSQYTFLPRINISAAHHMPLRRVHHDLQFYVAAFSYLRHAQLHFDYEFLQKQSVLSSELGRYRQSAREVLCLVEEAINNTNKLYAPSHKNTQKNQRGGKVVTLGLIKTVPRLPMEKRLMKFKTPLVELHKQAVLAANNKPAATPRTLHELDALFLKYQYIQYLKQMTQLLGKLRERNCSSKSPRKTTPRLKPLQKRPKQT
ncbi:uncharacterized protein LOC117788073 [Drosophila innubila]|uniref:uncharacterized protein LOC117788073 n=1 Tax=Drosophila innubila TaxID=198719 RepID=UPI00148B6186|nr:uncharacterized protein LOC117788073 [Drosophila innubila]